MPYITDIPSIAVVCMLALFLTLIQRRTRVTNYKIVAANHAGYELDTYERMLEGKSENEDVILWGIQKHQTQLLRWWPNFTRRIAYADKGVILDSAVEVENILNRFFYAHDLQDKDGMRKSSRELRMLCRKVGGIRYNYLIPITLRWECGKVIGEIRQWEKVTHYIMQELHKPKKKQV